MSYEGTWWRVRDGGVIVTLGTIEGSGDRVEVAARLSCSPKCAHVLTYVVERHGTAWRVTGSTGPTIKA